MRILVTGANGLLGHNVVSELLKRNYDVRILVRNIRSIHFDLMSVELVEGSFTNVETLKMAITGCDAIVHIAALTDTNLLDYSDYRKTNVEASEQLIHIANDMKINKLVYISSTNTIGYGNENSLADENTPFQFPFTDSFYAQSKVEAENLFMEASLLPNRHVLIIHPSFLIGAYDTKPSSGKLLLMAYKKPVMFVPKGGKNFVAVNDVASVICNALTEGKNGEHYLATGVNLTFRNFYKLQSQLGNYNQFIIEIPDFLLKVIGKIGDLMRKFGIKTDICSMNLRQLIIREHYTNSKAISELSMPQTELSRAISEALNWFNEKGMIK